MSNPSKTRVLFVDDEPLVLQGLQRMLRPLSREWEMTFVDSGHKALQAMAEQPFGAIVSDMRMPGMNGAQLLSSVAASHPKTVRIILSGHADKNLIVQCVGSAHQFITKPCEPDALKSAVARACHFESSLKSEVIKELIAKMQTLPSMPVLFHQILQRVRDENCTLSDVSDIIASDLGMAAKILKLVNSAFFGLRRQVSSPLDAVSFLGLDTIKGLVLAVNAFSCFENSRTNPLNLESLWSHSMLVGNWCRNIARHQGASSSDVDDCFISGMLHDVGKLALIANLPDAAKAAHDLAIAEGLQLHLAEERVLGTNHAEIGGCLLSLWGLPSPVVEAITFHHNPGAAGTAKFTPLAAVHAADFFANEIQAPAVRANPQLDSGYISALALTECLQSWRELKP